MPDFEVLEKIAALSAEEKLELVKSAIYSDDHLFKVVFRISLIVDRENTEANLEWLMSRLSRDASATPS